MIRAITTTRYIDEDSGIEYTHEPIEESVMLSPIPGGFVLSYLSRDESPDAPNEWENTDIFLVHYHRDFWIENERVTERLLGEWYRGEWEDNEELQQLEQEYWIFPVAAYVHSGVVLSMGSGSHFPDQQWDVSHVGAVLVTRNKYWKNEEEAEGAAESIIAEWNEYFSGDVYGIVHERLDAEKQSVEIDDCWNFYGYDYAKAEMEGVHKAWVEREEQKQEGVGGDDTPSVPGCVTGLMSA